MAGGDGRRPRPGALFHAMQHMKNRVLATPASLQVLAMPLGIAVVYAAAKASCAYSTTFTNWPAGGSAWPP